MDRKNAARHTHYHAVAMMTKTNERAFASHTARLSYIVLRQHHGRRAARALVHWTLFKIGAKRLWAWLVVLPYLKRFRPHRIEQLRQLFKTVTHR